MKSKTLHSAARPGSRLDASAPQQAAKLLARLACGLFLLSGLSMAGAASVAAEDAAEERASAFRAATGAEKEDVPGGALMAGAYGIILVLFVGYAWHLSRGQRRLAGELDQLQKALERGPAGSDA